MNLAFSSALSRVASFVDSNAFLATARNLSDASDSIALTDFFFPVDFDPPFLPPPRPRFLSPPSPSPSSRSALVVHGSNLGRRLAAIVSSLGITAIPRKTTDASTPSSAPARDVPPRAVVVVVFDNASHARRARAFVDAGCVGRASYRSSGSSPGRAMISFANRRAYMSTDVRLSLSRASRIAAPEPFENVTPRRRR
tara:strand:- start:1374 stop:1964 length:591 start_codon:yes stop_codon:yes gene_type:complete